MKTVAQRLEAMTRKGEGCWEFTGYIDRYGYGVMKVNGRKTKAHRVAYELAIGPIPDGLTIDHLCRNRSCVNTDHLEVVTSCVNTLRGESVSARAARQTHCVNGHPFDLFNTYTAHGWRKCRTCDRLRYHARKQASLA